MRIQLLAPKRLFWFAIIGVTLGLPAAAAPAQDAPAKSKLLFAATFNEPSDKIQLKNGAKLGKGGSGVSEKRDDKAYLAEISILDDSVAAPVALIKEQYPVQDLQEMTVVAWYKPADHQAGVVTPFDLAGMALWTDPDKGWQIRVAAHSETKIQYWFHSGPRGPYAGWLESRQWVFVAFSWNLAANEVRIYQGTKTEEVKLARAQQRTENVGGLVERPDRAKRPDAIGNTLSAKHDRPFNGSIDNLRVYSNSLNEAALEQIRQADLRNEAPPEF